jgi:hypothetical protein
MINQEDIVCPSDQELGGIRKMDLAGSMVPELVLFSVLFKLIFGWPAGSLFNPTTWRLSSVSRARFVTTGAIDLKICTYVPLGKSNSQTSLILGLATRGPKPKTPKCYS